MSGPINITKPVALSILLVAGLVTNIVAMLIISNQNFIINPINRHLWCLSMVDIVTLFDMLWKILYILLSQSFDRYMWICKRDWQGTMFGYSKTRLLIIWIWMSISVMPGII